MSHTSPGNPVSDSKSLQSVDQIRRQLGECSQRETARILRLLALEPS